MAIRIVCRDCGSDDVARDAWASWDEDRQEWILQAVFDAGFCHRCEEEAKLVELPLLRCVPGADGRGGRPLVTAAS